MEKDESCRSRSHGGRRAKGIMGKWGNFPSGLDNGNALFLQGKFFSQPRTSTKRSREE